MPSRGRIMGWRFNNVVFSGILVTRKELEEYLSAPVQREGVE
jgi:hypothetical protein